MKTLLFNLDSILNSLLFWSLCAAVIVTLGAVINRIFSNWAASYRHAIWLATSFCILTTPVVSYWVPGILPRSSGTAEIETQFEPLSDSTPSSNTRPLSARQSALSTNETAAMPLSTEDVPAASRNSDGQKQARTRPAKQTPFPYFYAAIVMGWVAGMAIYAARIWRARIQLNTLFNKHTATTDEPLTRLVAKLANEVGLKLAPAIPCERRIDIGTVALFITQNNVGPLVWGVMPARLLIPSSLAELPQELQEAAIRHELAHVQRGDEWVRRFLVILRTVFWFHPMVRYCCDQVHLYAEKACDDQVLRVGFKPSEYSTLLLTLGRKQGEMERAFAISGMAQSQIASRIKSILHPSTSRLPISRRGSVAVAIAMLLATSAVFVLRPTAVANNGFAAKQGQEETKPSSVLRLKVGVNDWPQWGGTAARNNVRTAEKIPLDWDVKTGKNIRWSMSLGSASYGGVVVANGKVFTGTNNGFGYDKRFPREKDLGVLLCFNEADGKFLWQHSNEKLPTGRVNDWPEMGICSAPLVDDDRLWYVTNRGQVVCLDIEGFWDGENDGPFKQEELSDQKSGADVVWVFDMMQQLGVSQHNMANCSVTCAGDMLFVNTSQGVDEGHDVIPNKAAPSFICLSRETGGVLWTDNSPGKNILHGQWSSPAYAVLGDVPQVIFGGGDGYLYGFLAQGENGNSKLLWKFDCNPKESRYVLGGGATRNQIIATPVVYDGRVYVAVGEDPEHGEGPGHLWCIDPTKRGDVSPTLVFNAKSPDKPIEHKRIQALVASEGDFEKPNPNSAAVWRYSGSNPKVLEQTMHRSVSTVAISKDLLFVPDFSGVFHCLDAKTGKIHWTYDLLAACWASPMIVNDRVYISDEDGDVAVFKLSSQMELLQETNLGSAICTTPIVANDTLFITTSNRLWALQEGAKSEPTSGN